MLTFITVFGLVVGVCIFAAMAAAPYCEPAELHEANESERAALRREAEEANACLRCSTEADACGHCIAAKYSRRAAK